MAVCFLIFPGCSSLHPFSSEPSLFFISVVPVLFNFAFLLVVSLQAGPLFWKLARGPVVCVHRGYPAPASSRLLGKHLHWIHCWGSHDPFKLWTLSNGPFTFPREICLLLCYFPLRFIRCSDASLCLHLFRTNNIQIWTRPLAIWPHPLIFWGIRLLFHII